jgi:glucose/arabinose dehydrogenase/plastocyanin
MSRLLTIVAALALIVGACGAGATPPPAATAPPAATPTTAPTAAPPAASPSTPPTGSPAAPAAPQMHDPALAVEVADGGLTEPTAMAFLGPDDFFVTEKSTGQVHRVTHGASSEPVIDLAVNFFDERGLLGIALHPDFATNGFVYLYWTWTGQGEGDQKLLGADTDDARTLPDLGNRVDRFHWDGSTLTWDRNLIQLRSNTLDTDTSGRIRGNHDAGPLVFGHDGKLFLVIGDQNQRSQLQNIPTLPAPDDIHFTGVILRLNDDGSTPTDNPFFAAGAAIGGEPGENVQKIWAYGIRNSFGLAIHPTTGALWETENGDDSWDEVNVFPAGSNSGWIQLMGPPERFTEFKQIEVDSPDGLDNKDYPPTMLASEPGGAQERMFELEGSTYVPPVFAWKHPVAVTSIALVTDGSLGDSSTGTAWLGTVLTDSLLRYPLKADGSGFDLSGGLADKVDDNTAKGDVGESADYVVGTGFGVVTDIVLAPDHLLYVSSISAGAVYRIGPVAAIGGGPSAVPSAPASAPAGAVVEITVGTDTGGELRFDPATVEVAAGAHVRLTFENRATVPHNLTFGDPIKAATATIVAPGTSETIEFVAPAAGTYHFMCTLHPGMSGTLQVVAG